MSLKEPVLVFDHMSRHVGRGGGGAGGAGSGCSWHSRPRLGRKVIFMVPLSPKPCDGLHFNWGCAFTKQQNKKARPVLCQLRDAETQRLSKGSKRRGCAKTLQAKRSMGDDELTSRERGRSQESEAKGSAVRTKGSAVRAKGSAVRAKCSAVRAKAGQCNQSASRTERMFDTAKSNGWQFMNCPIM